MMNELVKSEINDMNEVMEHESFKIIDVDGANWAFRKISALKSDIADKKELADKERLRIDTWEKSETEGAKQSIEFFEGMLVQYFQTLRALNPKAKVSTPYGKITTRKSTKWNYKDEEKLLEYVKQNSPDLIEVKESINKNDVKKRYKDGVNTVTGELLPGVEISKEESISVKAD